ncbi:MAG: ribose 5-phosphate isomerase B [Ignavibacteriales bacterium]|nr:MAG: ribose 5-phosphate isomerase B [Ignavibacteriales bacterium]
MTRLITEDDVKKVIQSGNKEIVVEKGSVLTPLAKDRIFHSGLRIVESESSSSSSVPNSQVEIAIGSDHTGVKIKKIIFDFLKQKGYDIIDVGTFTEDAVDYPDIAFNVANRVAIGEVNYGILIDATGIPSAITANKIPGIRAATCYNEFSAKSSREHNDANVLAVGARSLGEETIKSITEVWLSSKFLGDRHQKRLDKIKAIEEKYSKKL